VARDIVLFPGVAATAHLTRGLSLRSRFSFLHRSKTCCGGDALQFVTTMKTPDAINPTGKAPVIRAAAYVRMSTEHQQYSTSNQMDVIREYALRRNMEIVTTYSDEGKSGLNIQGRESLGRMIADVQNKRADYSARWRESSKVGRN